MMWFIQNILFSISLIVIIHYLYLYFETTLTTPKVKDLIHCPKQKYNSLFETINSKIHSSRDKPAHSSSYTSSVDNLNDGDDNSNHLGLGIVPKHRNNGGSDDTNDHNGTSTSSTNKHTAMKNDLKSFLRTIGLKKQSTQPPRAPYEMN
jgi:hypothetical protein